eukprot:TRINITY_DN2518_c0_g1_i2.p1 TRINITY_DN2518_c0_g1~~TRINITY_DN2518_c0_g1_i2.p1  ORF type:complete len:107 (+),score=45.13 TRINITY_DN2518_c0_g1_i2:71-391(+)
MCIRDRSYVIPTSTDVDITGVDVSKIDDSYFAKLRAPAAKKSESAFFTAQTGKSEEEQKRLADKKKTQSQVDAALLNNIKKVELLKNYLSARFTLKHGQRPHELIF